jgi:hypothetical protein
MAVKKHIENRFWNIAKRLSSNQLQRESESNLNLSDNDFFKIDIGKRGHNYFLGYYSKSGMELVLNKYGVYKELAKKGFKNIDLVLDTADPYRHRLTLYDITYNRRRMIVELILKKSVIQVEMPFKSELNGTNYETIAIEWLCMQNPDQPFSKKRPQLPGQNHPGLGLASKTIQLIMISAWRLRMSALLNIPDHYHNAFLYSRIFRYINPKDEGRLIAMIRDTKKYDLATVAWAIQGEAIVDKNTGDPVKWFISQQILPFDERLIKLFESKEYHKAIDNEAALYKFELDMHKYELYKCKRRNNEAKSNTIA